MKSYSDSRLKGLRITTTLSPVWNEAWLMPHMGPSVAGNVFLLYNHQYRRSPITRVSCRRGKHILVLNRVKLKTPPPQLHERLTNSCNLIEYCTRENSCVLTSCLPRYKFYWTHTILCCKFVSIAENISHVSVRTAIPNVLELIQTGSHTITYIFPTILLSMCKNLSR